MKVSWFVPIVAIGLTGCTSLASQQYWDEVKSDIGLQAGTPAQADSPPIPESPASGDMIPYNQGAGVTWDTANRLVNLGWYQKGQSTQAMRSLLGTPARFDHTTDVYPILGTGDRVTRGNELVILYRPDPDCNYQCSTAYDWYIQ